MNKILACNYIATKRNVTSFLQNYNSKVIEEVANSGIDNILIVMKDKCPIEDSWIVLTRLKEIGKCIKNEHLKIVHDIMGITDI